MPKILLYITAKIIWQFLFWNTDYNENPFSPTPL